MWYPTNSSKLVKKKTRKIKKCLQYQLQQHQYKKPCRLLLDLCQPSFSSHLAIQML